jgi:hypothetical protein
VGKDASEASIDPGSVQAMNHVIATERIGPLYSLDKFEVSAQSLPIFLHRIRSIHHYLGGLEGCVQNLVLTQIAGPGRFNVVTLVEWTSRRHMMDARDQVQEHYRSEGFDPVVFMARLGVRADMGVYALVDTPVC